MRRAYRLAWLAGAAMALSWIVTGPSHAAPFSASLDRYEIDGNGFGSADGVFDFVDDFNNGTLAPEWTVLLGTASESGGVATISSPGVPIQLGNQVLDISTLENALHDIGNGEGNFTENSYWTALPTPDSTFDMQLYSISPIIEAAGLVVTHVSPGNVQPGGPPAGYSITASVTQGFGSGFTTLVSNTVSILASSVTGEIVLRMSLDDSTDMLTCSFSLDGGLTFSSPFPPMHIFNGGVADYDILLGAAAPEATTPPPPPQSVLVPTHLLDVKNPDGLTKRKVTYKVRENNFSGSPAGIGNPDLYGGALVVNLDGAKQCFALPPGAFWRHGHGSQTYKDSQGVYGPVKVVAIKISRSRVLTIKASLLGRLGQIDVVPPNPGTQGDVGVVFGGGSEYCSSTAGGTIVKNDAKEFKAKDAPVPGACHATCSPGGAFLD
jgi:hypothetical protein